MIWLEDALQVLLEGQAVSVFNEDGDYYFQGYVENLNGEIPVPRVKVVGIFANYDKKKDMDVLEIVVREKKRGRRVEID